jgi:hypothetical protein
MPPLARLKIIAELQEVHRRKKVQIIQTVTPGNGCCAAQSAMFLAAFFTLLRLAQPAVFLVVFLAL